MNEPPEKKGGVDGYGGSSTAFSSKNCATPAGAGERLRSDENEEDVVLNGYDGGGREGDVPARRDEENDDEEEEAGEFQDYRGFAALVGAGPGAISQTSGPSGPLPTRKQQISSQSIRKGEKDFEEHGTRFQRDALEQSRAVMESVLSHTRVHYGGLGSAATSDIVRGWYFPDVWKDEPDEAEIVVGATMAADNVGANNDNLDADPSSAAPLPRRFAHTRHRVVMVEAERGTMFASVGAVPGRPKWIEGLPKEQQPKPRQGFDHVWLLPEEALFLVERGSMELWWPLKPIEDILEAHKMGKSGKPQKPTAPVSHTDGDDEEDEDGITLSLQAAYSLLIGDERAIVGADDSNERGRIPLPFYQVYSHLRRSGYQVLRAVKVDTTQTPLDPPEQHSLSLAPKAASPVTTVWQWFFSLLGSSTYTGRSGGRLASGPLVQPGLYRSYNSIFAQLRLIPPHRHLHSVCTSAPPSSLGDDAPSPNAPPNPFRVVYHVWKAGKKGFATFSRTRPPPPDFYMAVTDAHATSVPSLNQVTGLLASVPPLPAKPLPSHRATSTANPAASAGFPPLPVIYRRLKWGRRCVIVAVVDHGIVNYMRFADGSFGADPLYPRFDAVASGRFAGRRGNGGKNHGKKGQSKKGNYKGAAKTKSTPNKGGAK